MRSKGLRLLFSLAAVILFAFTLFAQQDEITITTYYPSPFGSYNELNTNMLTFTPRPQLQRPADQEGRMYYDSDTHSFWYFNGVEWREIKDTGAELEMGRITNQGGLWLNETSEWHKTYGWDISGDHIIDDGTACIDSQGRYCLRIDTSRFGRGIAMIRWGGKVGVVGDAVGRWIQLNLQAMTSHPQSSWTTIDSTGRLTYDELIDANGDGINDWQDYEFERTASIDFYQRTWYAFRIIAKKSKADRNKCEGVWYRGFNVTVSRGESF